MRKTWSNKLVEDDVPIPSFRIDSILLYQKLHQLKSGKDDSPLLFIGGRSSLINKVHYSINKLFYFHSWMSEKSNQCMQRDISGSKVKFLYLIYQDGDKWFNGLINDFVRNIISADRWFHCCLKNLKSQKVYLK